MIKVFLGSNPVDNEAMLVELEASQLQESEDYVVQNEQPEEGGAYILVPRDGVEEYKMLFPFNEDELVDIVTDYMMNS